MVTSGHMMPVYLMEMSKEFDGYPGSQPMSPREEADGLLGSIEATKKTIREHKANGWDASEFEVHLKSLEQRFKKAQEKIK